MENKEKYFLVTKFRYTAVHIKFSAEQNFWTILNLVML